MESVSAVASPAFLRSHPWIFWAALLALGLLIFYRREMAEGWRLLRSDPKAWLKVFYREWIVPLLWAVFFAFGIVRPFFLGPYKIPTGSMRPTFQVGDRIFVDKISYRFREPERGDILVFKYPLDKKKDFVKRLAGLPGEEIQIRDGRLIINGKVLEDPPFSENYYYNQEDVDWKYGKAGVTIAVPPKSYFVLGDNSAQSSDSRNWGFVPRKNVVGRAFCIWWPPNRIKLVD